MPQQFTVGEPRSARSITSRTGAAVPEHVRVAEHAASPSLTRRSRITRLHLTIGTLVLALTAVVAPQAWGTPAATADPVRNGGGDHRFERFLARYEAANTAFVNGDPSLWMAITTEREPASIFGGFGGLGEAGAEDVHQRYVLAAGAFRPSGAQVDFEYLVKDVRGRMAYTVAIERANVLYAGHTELQPQVLRVTMIFRFEKGDWHIVHRHADTMVDLQLPTP